jgi:glucose-1-phosphate cytidylyltransferase
MKVVLFCGGLGMRLRDYSDSIPKPMVEIGYRPILWHVMKYYASFGHKDFILCLGYKADVIKRYFVDYQEFISNDFVLKGDDQPQMLASDLEDWKITFVDTGYESCIGERLRRVREHLDGEEMFLANYSDNLTDFQLPELISTVEDSDAVAGFITVPPPMSFHITKTDQDGKVNGILESKNADLWINGGCFALRNEIFDFLQEGEELVIEAFARLIEQQRLISVRHTGFWQNMDTFKDRVVLNEMHEHGNAPWQVWNRD